MVSTSNESQLQLVLKTFEKDFQFSINKAVRLYNILYMTMSARIKGRSIHIDTITNSQKLTVLKEKIVVREIFDLDSRRFPLQIYDVEDMANRLLAIYDVMCIGLYWVFNFVKRQLEFYIRWNRLYDYQRV